MENQVTSYLEDSLSVVSSIVANKGLQSKIEQLALLIVSALKKGGKIMFIDNEVGKGQDGYAGCFGVAFDKFQLY